MKYQVHKLGGSCLKDLEMVKHSVNKVLEFIDQERKLVLAVSAIFGVTDIIRKCLATKVLDDKIINQTLSDIEEKHRPFIEFIPELNRINQILLQALKEALEKAQRSDLTEEIIDYVLVTGERFASQLIVNFINKVVNEKTAVLAYPEEIGLITDGYYFNAMINFDLDFHVLKHKLNSISKKGHKIIVIPGFYGINNLSKITTFGPSGSDYTASGIANILNAEKLIFWKDVDGFMTADPKLVKSFPVEFLNYDEAAELAHFGAKILHPKAITPAKLKMIPIEIRNIHGNQKTVISKNNEIQDTTKPRPLIKSIANIKNILLFKVYHSNRARQIQILDHVTEKFSLSNISVLAVTTSSTVVSFIINNNDLYDYNISELIKHPFIERTEEIYNLSFLSAIGEVIANEPGVAYRIFQVLAKANINVNFLSGGASPTTLQFTVENRQLKRSLNLIHNEMFPDIEIDPKIV